MAGGADGDRLTAWADELPPFAQLVASLADLGEEDSPPASAGLEEIRCTLAIELDVNGAAEQGAPRIGGSTPTQWTETTIMPVFHRLTVRIARSADA